MNVSQPLLHSRTIESTVAAPSIRSAPCTLGPGPPQPLPPQSVEGATNVPSMTAPFQCSHNDNQALVLAREPFWLLKGSWLSALMGHYLWILNLSFQATVLPSFHIIGRSLVVSVPCQHFPIYLFLRPKKKKILKDWCESEQPGHPHSSGCPRRPPLSPCQQAANASLTSVLWRPHSVGHLAPLTQAAPALSVWKPLSLED